MAISLSIVYPTDLAFRDRKDIEVALERSDVGAIVERASARYSSIDVSNVMTQLAQVGQLIQIAYAGSQGFPCSVSIIELLSNFQGLIKNSVVASNAFVEASLRSLKLYGLAFKLANGYNKFDKALQMISKCAEIAKEMADISSKLVNESQALCDLSKKSLKIAIEDKNVSMAERERIIKLMQETQEAEAKLKQKVEDLNCAIEEQRQRELAAAKQRQKARSLSFKAFAMSILVPPAAPITAKILHDADKEKSRAEAEGKVAAEKRADLQTQLRQENANLAETLCKLQHQQINKNNLQVALTSIEVVVKTLGKISTVFENARKFWMTVESHCKELSDIEEVGLLAEPELKEMFIDELKKSGFSWLVLAKINLLAFKTITDVDAKTDNIMTNLPSEAEAQELIKPLTQKILAQIKDEDANLDKE
jgi:hypothetical protein